MVAVKTVWLYCKFSDKITQIVKQKLLNFELVSKILTKKGVRQVLFQRQRYRHFAWKIGKKHTKNVSGRPCHMNV
jgi:tRNA isopentenyl-2-thiomethyl-A-37 hydroxylase MiaE